MLAVGLDVGNATTEAVLARLGGGSPQILGADRLPTRGVKGSPASLDGAAALLRRLERNHAVTVESVAVAPLRPVHTGTVMLPEPVVSTGRLRVLGAGCRTPGGTGAGTGRPYVVGTGGALPHHPVVAVVPVETGYPAALPELRALATAGVLVGVALGRDEGVLVANRLACTVPVVDEVDTVTAAGARLLLLEVCEPGRPLRVLGDPVRLVAEIAAGLDGHPSDGPTERADAARLAGLLADRSDALVAVVDRAPPLSPANEGWVQVATGEGTLRLPPREAHNVLRAGRAGTGRAYALPRAEGGEDARTVDDLFTVDLARLADTVMARRGSMASRTMVLAALDADAPLADPSEALAARLQLPVRVTASEPVAARLGGLSTPGVEADAAVVDVGAGTVDVVTSADAEVVAGGGELLTTGTAALLGISRAAAEWVKRGAAHRVEAPQVLLAEDGSRAFLDAPAAADMVGSLVAAGPAGLLPFDRLHSPGEWRALRLALKSDVLGGNVTRALRGDQRLPSSVLVLGGPAGDDEALGCVARALPAGTAVGRANAGGALGHRYAVAYGLLLALR